VEDKEILDIINSADKDKILKIIESKSSSDDKDYKGKSVDREAMFKAAIPNYEKRSTYGNPFVNLNKPNKVYLNPEFVEQNPTIPAHEFEHQLAGKGMARYKNENPDFIEEQLSKNIQSLGNFPLTAGKLISEFYLNSQKPEVITRLRELGVKDKIIPYLSRDKSPPLDEIIAQLSGMETTYNLDFTQDPVLKKILFNNDENLIQSYKAVTGLRQERLDARDLPPYTATKPATLSDKVLKLLKGTFGL
jgi:hypothetical protein